MQGFPKTIATRRDVENLLADPDYKPQALGVLQILLDERYGWILQGKLADGETGDVTPSHKVIASQDTATGEVTERYQYAWGLVPNSGLARLGVTAEEAVAWGCEGRVIAPPEAAA